MQNENLNMYQLGYRPNRLDDFNDYFLQYLKTNDSKFFNEFLHFDEPVLNRKATEFIKNNHIEEYRLPDLKQIFVSLLWDELQRYTADEKLPLLQIMKYKTHKAWIEYMRTDCGITKIESKNEHNNLRKVTSLYFKTKDTKPFDKIVKEISEQLHLSEKTVIEYIETALTTKYSESRESFEIENISEIDDIIFDNYKSVQIKDAIKTLSPIERRLLELTTGISFDTFETKEKLSYNKTALLLGMTESAVQKKRKRIIDKLKNLLGNN